MALRVDQREFFWYPVAFGVRLVFLAKRKMDQYNSGLIRLGGYPVSDQHCVWTVGIQLSVFLYRESDTYCFVLGCLAKRPGEKGRPGSTRGFAGTFFGFGFIGGLVAFSCKFNQ